MADWRFGESVPSEDAVTVYRVGDGRRALVPRSEFAPVVLDVERAFDGNG